MHTETTRSSGYWLGTVLLLYLLRTDAARVAGCVTTRSRSARRGRLGGRCSRCCNTLLPRSRCRRSSNTSSRQIRAAQLERVESSNDRGQQGFRDLLKAVLSRAGLHTSRLLPSTTSRETTNGGRSVTAQRGEYQRLAHCTRQVMRYFGALTIIERLKRDSFRVGQPAVEALCSSDRVVTVPNRQGWKHHAVRQQTSQHRESDVEGARALWARHVRDADN